MSDDAYLIAAVGGTFLSILLAGATFVTVSRGRRSAQVLRGQLESAGTQVAHAGASASFSERVLAPAIAR